MAALPVGTMIAGYRITKLLGAGGFGLTYQAESPFTKKTVAIKEFFPHGMAHRFKESLVQFADTDADLVNWALRRFEKSTLEQCDLNHPNIVDVIHYVNDNNTGYMIMEYVEGRTLESWLSAQQSLPSILELRPLIEPVFHALSYVHNKQLIHRDIAPDNIMVRTDGSPKIIDFGAIKVIEERALKETKASKSFVISKRYYSSPEQIGHNADLDARADVYSIGAVLYRAVCGMPPVSAEDRMQHRAFGKADPYVPLVSVRTQLPASFARQIDKSLSFRADERHSSIAEFSEAMGWGHKGVVESTIEASSLSDSTGDAGFKSKRYSVLVASLAFATVLLALFLWNYFSTETGKVHIAPIVTPPLVTKSSITNEKSGCETLVDDAAIVACSRDIQSGKLQPKELSVRYFFRSVWYRHNNDPERSWADLNEAIRLNPSYVDAIINRGSAFLERKEYDRAIADYSEVIRLDPKNSAAFSNRGAAFTRKGLPDKAIADFSEAIRIDPNYATAYHNRAFVYKSRSNPDYSLAISDYSEAIRLNPNYASAYYNRGISFLEKDQLDNAIADFNETIRLTPGDDDAFLARAFAYNRKGENERAISEFSEVIRLNPRSADGFYGRGNVYLNSGSNDRAIQDYNAALRINPNFAEAFGNRGLAYDRKGALDLALTDFNEALRLNPRDALTFYNRGNVFRKKGDTDRAIADHTSAINLDPMLAEPLTNRGALYRTKGDYDRAIADHLAALKINPRFVDARYNLANTYLSKGDTNLALENYNATIQLNDRFAAAYYNRAVIYRTRGEKTKAIADFRKVFQLDPSLGQVRTELENLGVTP